MIRKMCRIFSLCLIAALAIGLWATPAACRVVGTAEIKDCTQEDEGMDCKSKLVVSVLVSSGLTTVLNVLTVKTVDQNGDPLSYEDPVNLKITKSPVTVAYPHGKGFTIDLTVILNDDSHTFSLSPADPIYTTDGDKFYKGNFKFKAELAGDFPAYEGEHLVSRVFTSRVLFAPGEKEIPSKTESMVVLTMDRAMLKEITADSPATITEAQVEPYQEGARACDLNVKVKNVGVLDADYIVSVTDLGGNFAMAPARAVSLAAKAEADLTFRLHSDVPLNPGSYSCRASVKLSNGKLYDSVQVDF